MSTRIADIAAEGTRVVARDGEDQSIVLDVTEPALV